MREHIFCFKDFQIPMYLSSTINDPVFLYITVFLTLMCLICIAWVLERRKEDCWE